MKALRINIIIIFCLIYLSPDFVRLTMLDFFPGMPVTQTSGLSNSCYNKKVVHHSFSRRRFLPLVKSTDFGKLPHLSVKNVSYNRLYAEIFPVVHHEKIYHKLLLYHYHFNKAPPSLS